ncbi:ABC transporter, ATP-binding protein [Leifsonia xyli subsp. xyli str. CTCB07]|uniref:ABC transporter, ATP-binding protein n=1 Tax=Leifsonia xyli subsp. xyli (strain CTCB07) TaxID=281090 RepID=Q6ADD1_LEIXX|nr:ABC transporter, ATP-binding protein [Leifsonia xyli subsp. xyli str. CTCB07]
MRPLGIRQIHPSLCSPAGRLRRKERSSRSASTAWDGSSRIRTVSPRRTALDHAVFPLLTRGLSRRQAEAEGLRTLALFGLESVAHRPFRALSGGEAQRLMLARAVSAAPGLLLVDEPTAQLDTHTAHEVSATLGQVASSGSIVVVATHDPDTRAACTRVFDLIDYAPSERSAA